jgi:hypothetical protein
MLPYKQMNGIGHRESRKTNGLEVIYETLLPADGTQYHL